MSDLAVETCRQKPKDPFGGPRTHLPEERSIHVKVAWRRSSTSWYARSMRRRDDTRADEPMTLTVHLPDDLEQRLRERAFRDGRAVEEYVLGLIERDAARPASLGVETFGFHAAQSPALTDGEFEHLLDELASGPGLPRLPADFSRADIYADHD